MYSWTLRTSEIQPAKIQPLTTEGGALHFWIREASTKPPTLRVQVRTVLSQGAGEEALLRNTC
jgi:hypothetical protein